MKYKLYSSLILFNTIIMSMACNQTISSEAQNALFLNLDPCIQDLNANTEIKQNALQCQDSEILHGCLWLEKEGALLVSPVTLNADQLNIENTALLTNIGYETSSIKGSIAFYRESVTCTLDVSVLNQCNGKCLFAQEFKTLKLDDFDEKKIFTLEQCQWKISDDLQNSIDTVCDQIDNDCDGKVDENQQIANDTPCSTGVGACKGDGLYICKEIGQEPICNAIAKEPTAEICDGIDNDCNQQVDDLPQINQQCVMGDGVCRSTGVWQCDNQQLYCNAQIIMPFSELDMSCNGLDDNCNGLIDEDYQIEATICGIGSCVNSGVLSCIDGAIKDTCQPLISTNIDDDCDGEDDDCNGAIDDKFEGGVSICGLGICRNSGLSTCQRGVLIDNCMPNLPAENDQICNGLDDDCDGNTDEDYISRTIECGLAGCSQSLQSRCEQGIEYASCDLLLDSLQDQANAEICDGLDNNCNGEIDEGLEVTVSDCSIGACTSTGVRSCVAGVITDTCVPPMPITGVFDHCDGTDNDCDGLVDENFTSTIIYCGLGVCANQAVSSCQNGVLSNACIPHPIFGNEQDTLCNGLDNDCDGRIDEGYEQTVVDCGMGSCSAQGLKYCVNGEERNSCNTGAPASTDSNCDGIDEDCDGLIDENVLPVDITCGLGSCLRNGRRACVNGAYIDQCEQVIPQPQETDALCDRIDQDCDGRTDEGFQVSPVTCGVGYCANVGLSSCDNGTIVNHCEPKLSNGNDQDCNLIDNDCDGRTDESSPIVAVTCGIGACMDMGQRLCISGTITTVCSPRQPTTLNDNSCNGIDDDCDGRTDENYVNVQVYCGTGSCRAVGTKKCEAGREVTYCTPSQPSSTQDASCNNTDEDCDGRTDENYVPTMTSCGQGACQSSAPTACVAGVVVNTCTPQNATALDNQCDGLDNDCDGITDEGFSPYAINCGIGVCQRTGNMACVNGSLVSQCTPGAPTSSSELCNSLDDNCNGSIDENFGRLLSCGTGACLNSAVSSCVNGVEQNNCTPRSPTSELCGDNIDQDCDGRTDEGFNVGTSCSAGVGACLRSGTFVCSSNKLSTVCNAVAANPSAEYCNGIDDDCDGMIDDSPVDVDLGCEDTRQFGQCRYGITQCGNQRLICVTNRPDIEAFCPANARDEDCDGAVDEATILDPVSMEEIPINYVDCFLPYCEGMRYSCLSTGLVCKRHPICDQLQIQ